MLILKFKKYEKVFFLFTSVLFLILSVISLYHLGIEQEVFKESMFCSLNNNQEILSKEDLLNQLNQMPISCKNVTFKLFGLSLTTYNVLLSLIIFFINKTVSKYNETDKNKVKEFIRVDHAGEKGAVKIYEGQLLALNTIIKNETLKKTIEEMRLHEKEHCEFLKKKLKKEILNQQYFYLYGFIRYWDFGSAIIGKKAAMLCTASVRS